jgi:hypothetical protein
MPINLKNSSLEIISSFNNILENPINSSLEDIEYVFGLNTDIDEPKYLWFLVHYFTQFIYCILACFFSFLIILSSKKLLKTVKNFGISKTIKIKGINSNYVEYDYLNIKNNELNGEKYLDFNRDNKIFDFFKKKFGKENILSCNIVYNISEFLENFKVFFLFKFF